MARTGTRRRWRRLVAGAGLLAAGGACGPTPLRVDEFEASTGVRAPAQPAIPAGGPPGRIPEVIRDPGAVVEDRSQPTAEGARPIGFADGAEVAATALAALPGERSLIDVVLYDGYGIVVSQAANGDVERVVVRAGATPDVSTMPTAIVRDPAAERFAVTDLDWGLVPGLVDRTPGDLGIDGGTVSHVIVEKNVPFSPDLVIRVYVSTDRRSGRIDYLADGRVLRAFAG